MILQKLQNIQEYLKIHLVSIWEISNIIAKIVLQKQKNQNNSSQFKPNFWLKFTFLNFSPNF